MANIVGIGIATLDIINTTDGYPNEDAEVRASSQAIMRGGNVTNTLSVLSQYGHHCYWGGTLADDHGSTIIKENLKQHQVDFNNIRVIKGGHSPTSYITLNKNNGSRTIVHYRDLPEFHFDDFCNINLNNTDWLHFEGRNTEQVLKMVLRAKDLFPALPISLEIEKSRLNIETLFNGPDVLFFSKHYAHEQGYNSAQQLLESVMTQISNNESKPLLLCTWGDKGAYALENDTLMHADTIQQTRAVDTIGAGDTFNAGFIHHYLQTENTHNALTKACELASKKCAQTGFEDLIR